MLSALCVPTSVSVAVAPVAPAVTAVGEPTTKACSPRPSSPVAVSVALVDATPFASSRLSTTVRVSVAPLLPVPSAPSSRTICPFALNGVNPVGRLSAGTVRTSAVLPDCAETVIVPLASPLTVTEPAPPASSLPPAR